jgi:hypothetical protein
MYCFGICNASAVPEELNAFVYTEDQGLKSGNNVASLLLYAFKTFGWLVEGEPTAQLTIIMDNCSGQKKNRQVLRLALLLVELQYFDVVEFIFYVKGRTKNICVRMFNQLIMCYHRANIYNMDQASEHMNAMANVKFIPVTLDFFLM